MAAHARRVVRLERGRVVADDDRAPLTTVVEEVR
jgi:hypothetical protein